MGTEIIILNKFNYQKREWLISKILFVSFWLLAICLVSGRYISQPFPEGICQFFNCTFIIQPIFRGFVLLGSLACAILYILEKRMIFSLIVLSIVSIIIFSIERSNGIYHREELFSLIFVAQLIAYLRYKFSSPDFQKKTVPHNVAMFYSISVIAGSYMIAGISKLQISGLSWISESHNVALQILQSMEHKSIDSGLLFLVPYGDWLSTIILKHPTIIHIVFAFALCVELLAFIALSSKKHAFYYGLLLLFVHLGMFLLLFVKLVVFIWSVLIFMVNFSGLFVGKPFSNER